MNANVWQRTLLVEKDTISVANDAKFPKFVRSSFRSRLPFTFNRFDTPLTAPQQSRHAILPTNRQIRPIRRSPFLFSNLQPKRFPSPRPTLRHFYDLRALDRLAQYPTGLTKRRLVHSSTPFLNPFSPFETWHTHLLGSRTWRILMLHLLQHMTLN